MPFTPIEPEKISQSIVQQIELLILRGILRPAERLPSERDLADRFGVSRPSVREAIAVLHTRGLLTSRPNAGIFVAEVLGSAFSPALIELFSTHQEAVFDSLTFRRDLEGLAAERAARHASNTDLQVIATVFDRMEAAHQKRDPEEESDLDAKFHLAIIEASHNVILLHMMRSMYDLLRQGVFYNRQILFKNRPTRDLLLDQHRAIKTAILARQPQEARLAVARHMDFIEQAMHDQVKADKHEAIARLRLEHEHNR
ncbi:MAG: FCD domain-containing protein [Microgenomates group bacterium]|jgi:GntR family transcriptional repressor for pyruvate dehydrogenase complex